MTYEDLYSGPLLSYITKHRTGNSNLLPQKKERNEKHLYIFKICILEQTEWKKDRSKVSLLPEAIYQTNSSVLSNSKVLFFMPGD